MKVAQTSPSTFPLWGNSVASVATFSGWRRTMNSIKAISASSGGSSGIPLRGRGKTLLPRSASPSSVAILRRNSSHAESTFGCKKPPPETLRNWTENNKARSPSDPHNQDGESKLVLVKCRVTNVTTFEATTFKATILRPTVDVVKALAS